MKLPLWRIAEFVGSKGECDQEAVAMGYSIDSRTAQCGRPIYCHRGRAL